MDGPAVQAGEVETVAAKAEWTEAEARFLIEAQETSGLNVTEFSRRYGFMPQRLHRWMSKLGVQRKAPARPSTPPSVFTPVRVIGPRPATGGTLEVVVRGTCSVRVGTDFDVELLRRVVAALEVAPC